MTEITRRSVLQGGTALATTGALAGTGILRPTESLAQQSLSFKPEQGATLRVLRWSKFVQGDEDLWIANTKKFTETTGVNVRIDNEAWEDVRPKAAVAANVGSGPDIISRALADRLLIKPETVAVTPPATTAEKVEQEVFFVEKADKRALLVDVLRDDREYRPRQAAGAECGQFGSGWAPGRCHGAALGE